MSKPIILSPVFYWLIPYLVASERYLPRGKRVTRVGAWKRGGRCGKKEQAAIFTNDSRNYRIYLHTMTFPRHQSEPSPFSKIDILGNLAHELAHMHDWDHTPRHSLIEAKLKVEFSKILDKEGYISEEDELREI